jgi:hypothetical protein
MMIEKENKMRGSIRTFVGFFIVFGAVGGLDTGSATLLQGTLLAVVGLGLMFSGVNAMGKL